MGRWFPGGRNGPRGLNLIVDDDDDDDDDDIELKQSLTSNGKSLKLNGGEIKSSPNMKKSLTLTLKSPTLIKRSPTEWEDSPATNGETFSEIGEMSFRFLKNHYAQRCKKKLHAEYEEKDFKKEWKKS